MCTRLSRLLSWTRHHVSVAREVQSAMATASSTRPALHRARTGCAHIVAGLFKTGLPRLEPHSVGDLDWVSASISLSSVVCELVAEIQSQILPVVRPDWTPGGLGYRVFEEGTSNKLLGFFQVGNTEDMVLVRVNGVGRDLFIDSRAELIVMLTMHKAGMSPPVYLVAENALCYGYIPGETLTAADLQTDSVLKATACAIAQFHAVPVPDPLQGSKPQVWAKIDRWMELVAGECNFSEEGTTKRFTQVMGSVEHLKQEIVWLRRELGADRHSIAGLSQDGGSMTCNETSQHLPCDSHTVLCHNDPQPLNFILSPDGTVSLIDFEYSGKNYPAFDIGCFFCEFAGVHGTVDYNRYPSESVQKTWIRYYLEECARLRGDDPNTITSEQIHSLYKDANKFALAAHFMWTLWSLIQCQYSTIDFDYLEYGCIRYEEYKRRKKIII